MTPAPEGLLILDKPGGMTSHDVVACCRRLLHTRRVGHAGTLDPMATGVLVLGVGRATRLLRFLVGSDKTYQATMRLGQRTVTDDAEGETMSTHDASRIGPDELATAVATLTGPIDQAPSAVSAIKVDGRRSYDRVRAGDQVALAARPVVVYRFEVRALRPGPVCEVEVETEVSSGTYVRALARDLGERLGVGGHLSALRRTRVGPFQVGAAVRLDELQTQPERRLLSLADAARAVLPARELTPEETLHVGYGRPVPVVGGRMVVAAFAPDGTLVAVLDQSGERAVPRVVLAPAAAAGSAQPPR